MGDTVLIQWGFAVLLGVVAIFKANTTLTGSEEEPQKRGEEDD